MTTSAHKLEFTEKISIPHAKALLSISKDDFLKAIYNPVENDKAGKKFSKAEQDIYVNSIKKYLRLMISKGGSLKQKYKYPKGMEEVECGRIYVNHFGIQSLQYKVRGFLCQGIYNDYDMKNCFPTLLLWFCKRYFPDIDIKYLEVYVNHREKCLKSYQVNKLDVITDMNRDTRYKGNNKFLKKISKTFGIIQDRLWNDTENELLQQVDKNLITSANKKGSFLSRALGIIENEILQEVCAKFKDDVGVPMFDGLFLNADLDIEETLDTLNEITKEYNVTWTHKKHDTLNIEVCEDDDLFSDDEDDEPEKLYGHDFIEYEDLKRIFEETGEATHSVITTPIMYVKEYPDYYSYDNKSRKTLKHEIYTQSQLTELYRNLYYQERVMKKGPDGNFYETIVDNKFINKWLDDKNRKTKLKIDFVPEGKHKICPPDVYNIFKGFQSKIPKHAPATLHHGVKRFLDHISLLCNHDEETTEYLIDYIADMFQNPQTLPTIAIVMKSKQGLGKDLLINYLEKMMGEEYVFRTSDIKRDIFGTFNPSVRGKLLVQFNELQGKDGFAFKEDFKNFITALKLNINEKNVKQFTIKNSIRPIVFSNAMTPVEIPVDDRRFVVIKGADLLPADERNDYYNPLFTNLNDPHIVDLIYKYFMERDISQRDFKRDRPITQAYKNMKEGNIPPMAKYMYELMTNEDFADLPIRPNKKQKELSIVPINSLLSHYKMWYEKVYEGRAYVKKDANNALLELLNFTKEKKNTPKHGRIWCYMFDKEKTIELLETDYDFGDDVDDDDEYDFSDGELEFIDNY